MIPGLIIHQMGNPGGTVDELPSSKSVSNRVLILDALAGGKSDLTNLSQARDTQLMRSLVRSDEREINAMDAGTTMRFLTAYFAVSGSHRIMTGTDRMKERPIHPLVDALRILGADIRYLEREGYPPLEIRGFGGQRTREVSVPGNLSSQFISALMMIGPSLPQGLLIRLEGHIGSKPYIEMTAAMMRLFGASVRFEDREIEVSPGGVKPVEYSVEPDWSAASYWFSFCALSPGSRFKLNGNFEHSFQGDQVMADIGRLVGVESVRTRTGLELTATDHESHLEWDFTDCPDLAQTVAPLCACKGITGIFTGLESLRIKETDRITALQTVLARTGAGLNEIGPGVWELRPAGHTMGSRLEVSTYHDHRMAMGFAPWATRTDVVIDDPDVINKSYPGFWRDMNAVGFRIETLR